jgi:hypothetical protein
LDAPATYVALAGDGLMQQMLLVLAASIKGSKNATTELETGENHHMIVKFKQRFAKLVVFCWNIYILC